MIISTKLRAHLAYWTCIRIQFLFCHFRAFERKQREREVCCCCFFLHSLFFLWNNWYLCFFFSFHKTSDNKFNVFCLNSFSDWDCQQNCYWRKTDETEIPTTTSVMARKQTKGINKNKFPSFWAFGLACNSGSMINTNNILFFKSLFLLLLTENAKKTFETEICTIQWFRINGVWSWRWRYRSMFPKILKISTTFIFTMIYYNIFGISNWFIGVKMNSQTFKKAGNKKEKFD